MSAHSKAAAAAAEAIADANPSVCPRCGGALEHESDRQGYGQTIEQCEHVATCGYWRTLEGPRIPAHTRAPRGAEPVRRRHAAVPPGGARGRRGETHTRLLAALPKSAREALGVAELAARVGHPPKATAVWCSNTLRAGKHGVQVVREGKRCRYWRRAA